MKANENQILKGNVNSLVQVVNNMISNAIQAYNGKHDQNIELDVIAICCETTEYSNSALHDFQDLINDYCQYYDMDDYCEDNDIKLEDVDKNDYIHKLIEKLEENTTVLHLNNNGYIIFEF